MEGHQLVGQSEGCWLNACDFISTDGRGVDAFGELGFPKNWPKIYGTNPVLKTLVGKRGLCPAKKLCVMGVQTENERSHACGLYLRQLQSFENAEALQAHSGLRVVRGWAIFECYGEPAGTVFVAERYWWNATSDGWVDFTPRPPRWPHLLLAEALEETPKARSVFSRAEANLAARLVQLRFGAHEGASETGDPSGEVRALQEELLRASREADEACSEQRMWESKVAHRPSSGQCSARRDSSDTSFFVGSLVRVHKEGVAQDLVGQEATICSWDVDRGGWEVFLSTGETKSIQAENLQLVDQVEVEPKLSIFGCEVHGALSQGDRFDLWPLVHSGFIRTRVPERLLIRLNVECDELLAERASLSHAPFLEAEIKSGRQLRVRRPDAEYVNLLLTCADRLRRAIVDEDDIDEFKCELDTVWTVHQLAGDYNPVHFHTNQKAHFGFSSFLHLQLPPQLCSAHQRSRRDGARDGTTNFMWKADHPTRRNNLELSGNIECELAEGYLYVFPQWLQHFVWPFRGPGERRTMAANIALVPVALQGVQAR